MERKWMYGMNISDPEYVNGVQSFLIATESDRVAKGNTEIFCSCSQCKNFVPYDDMKAIEYHLLKCGFVRNYTCWSEHGESLVDNTTSSHVLNANENNESYINDIHGNLNKMLHDLDANDGDINQEDLQQLFEDAKKPVYDGCNFSRKDDGKLRHVADSPQWRKINNKFLEFAKEIRNIRFGLSSDGINPFENMSSRYSPKQPGNDIDVYLSPLINDMKTLWKPSVEMYDAYMKEKFRLHAMIFCTINDFPAYGNLSGYSTKGKQACPICEDETSSRWLDNCKKTVFMGHRRSLPSNHPYRGMSLEFDGHTEYGRVRIRFSGDIALSRVSNLNTVFGKGKGRQIEQGTWKKKSIFWELEYWKDLEVRHCIDVMHIEKNVCDSLLGLLLNIPGKLKMVSMLEKIWSHGESG
nr:hypothetical protein [Tanacetum cinerariifolium]